VTLPQEEIPARCQGRGEFTFPPVLVLAIVLGLTFLAYSGTLQYAFVHDDRGQILDNPDVHSWRFLPRYFAGHVWSGVMPSELGNYYRPVFLLWLRLNDMLFGAHPSGWHFTTVFLHVLVTLLVYRLAFRVTDDRWAAGIAALLFGLHPVHIEAVSWISGVTEPLLGALLVPAFLCYLRRHDSPAKGKHWLALSLAFYALAMLAKETALVLPAVILLYELLYRPPRKGRGDGRLFPGALRSVLPYLALVPPYLLARVWALKGLSHTATPLPVSTLLFTWPSLLWFWARHLIWPVGLSTFYDLPAVSHPGLRNFTLPAIGVLLLLLLLALVARRSRAVAFACAWLVLPLLPVLDIRVFVNDNFAQDRYLYLPSIGLAIMGGLALRRLDLARLQFRGQPLLPILLSALLGGVMAFGVARQSAYFANETAFYTHNLRAAPRSKLAKVNLGALRGEQGRYDEAARLFLDILRDEPDDWLATYNLGYTYYRLGELDDAERTLRRAIAINPEKPDQFLYLGVTLFKRGRMVEAQAAIRRAIRIRPNGHGYHFALGMVLKSSGDFPAAVDAFRTELACYPQESAARDQIAEIEARVAGSSPAGSRRP